MQAPSEYHIGNYYFKALVYGDPGVGKTSFVAEAMDVPSMGEVLFLNIEGGMLTIADRKPKYRNIGVDDKGRPNGRALADLEEVIIAIVSGAEGYKQYKTVVLDSASELQVRDIEDVVTESRKKKDRPIDELTQNDYGKDTARMRRVLRMLRDAPINVFITALAKRVEKESTLMEVSPQLTKALSQSIRGYMDFVWYLTTREKDGARMLLTRQKGPYQCKTRLQSFQEAIGDHVENPSLVKIVEQLNVCLKGAE